MNCHGSKQQFDLDIRPNFGAPFDSLHSTLTPKDQMTYNCRAKKNTVRRRPPRHLFILFVAVILLTATSCVSGADSHPTQSPAAETAAPTAIEELSVSIEEQVLLNQQGVKITALSLIKNPDGTAMEIQIENLGANTVTVTLWHARVNGIGLESDDMNCVVEAGKNATAEISLQSHLVITVRDVELGFRIHDNAAMTDTDSDVITIGTIVTDTVTLADETDDPATQRKNGVIYKEGGITIYVGSYQEPSASGDSPAFEAGIVNDSDHEVNAYFRSFVVNGQAVESARLQFHRIHEGNSWTDWFLIDSDELAYLGITAFLTVDFQMEVRTSDGLSDNTQIFNVSLSFPESTGNDFEFIYPEITSVTEDIEAEPEKLLYTVDEQVLCDQYGIKLTVVSLDAMDKDPHSENLRLNLLMENNTGNQIIGKTTYVAINGVMVNANFSHSNFIEIINPEEQCPCYIDISNESLVAAGIQTIKDIEFNLELILFNNYKVQNKYSIYALILTTAPESFIQSIDDSGIIILDQDGVKVVAQGFHKDFDSDTSFVKLYIENSSDRIVVFELSNVTINGERHYPPNFHLTVYPDKIRYDKIEYSLGDLDYGDSLVLRLLMRDADSNEKIFETDDISLTFQQ